jgi:hypothetical protein
MRHSLKNTLRLHVEGTRACGPLSYRHCVIGATPCGVVMPLRRGYPHPALIRNSRAGPVAGATGPTHVLAEMIRVPTHAAYWPPGSPAAVARRRQADLPMILRPQAQSSARTVPPRNGKIALPLNVLTFAINRAAPCHRRPPSSMRSSARPVCARSRLRQKPRRGRPSACGRRAPRGRRR